GWRRHRFPGHAYIPQRHAYDGQADQDNRQTFRDRRTDGHRATVGLADTSAKRDRHQDPDADEDRDRDAYLAALRVGDTHDFSLGRDDLADHHRDDDEDDRDHRVDDEDDRDHRVDVEDDRDHRVDF